MNLKLKRGVQKFDHLKTLLRHEMESASEQATSKAGNSNETSNERTSKRKLPKLSTLLKSTIETETQYFYKQWSGTLSNPPMHSTYLVDVELQFLPRTVQREQIGHQQSIQSVHNFVTVARWSKIVMLYKDAVDST